jgi:hypothetical protein
MTDQLNKHIDGYLEVFKSKQSDTVTDKEIRNRTIALRYDSKIMEATIRRMIELDIVVKGRDLDGDTWTLTARGLRILKVGSWTKYLELEGDKEKLAIRQILSTIDTNENVKKTNKRQVIILALTLFIAATSAWISWLSYKKSDPEQRLKSLEYQMDSIKRRDILKRIDIIDTTKTVTP